MRFSVCVAVTLVVLSCGNPGTSELKAVQPQPVATEDKVTVSFDMADAGVGLIELAAAGADDAVLRKYFFHQHSAVGTRATCVGSARRANHV